MLKIVIIILLALIIYFVIRMRRGMSKIDGMFDKKNVEDMKQLQAEIQAKINENKINKKYKKK